MLPEKVIIGCYEYTVEVTDDVLELNGRTYKGIISPEHNTIRICSKYSEQSREQTFWHEVLHGLMHYRMLDPHECDVETTVEELAMALYGLMKSNGKLPGQKEAI